MFGVHVPSQGCERSCICVLEVTIWPLIMSFQLDFGTVPTVQYFFYFILVLLMFCIYSNICFFLLLFHSLKEIKFKCANLCAMFLL
jgi:hypothetical protein